MHVQIITFVRTRGASGVCTGTFHESIKLICMGQDVRVF